MLGRHNGRVAPLLPHAAHLATGIQDSARMSERPALAWPRHSLKDVRRVTGVSRNRGAWRIHEEITRALRVRCAQVSDQKELGPAEVAQA